MSATVQTLRGLKAAIPVLAEGRQGFCNDVGAEELWIGTAAGNVLIAAWDVFRKSVGGTIDADVVIGAGHTLTLAADPTLAMEAATKQYVDSTSGAVELTWDADYKALTCVK